MTESAANRTPAETPAHPGGTPKNKGGRPRLSIEEKARRQTLKAYREGLRKQNHFEPEAAVLRDYLTIAREYAADVAGGRVVACEWVKAAVERARADRARGASWGFAWADEAAIEACAFIERLPHVEGHWKTATIRLEPWQVWIVSELFGWRHRDDPARRRFTSLYLETGRKAAKSTLMAGLALYHVCREREPGGQVVCGATTGSQARIVFNIAASMAKRAGWLRTEGVQVFANAIITPDATIRSINSKASTQDGLNPSCIVLDESHAQTFELHDVLRSAQGARRNPLMLCPTTAGYDQLSVGFALRSSLIKVLQGVYPADHLFGAIYTLDEGDDWRDETTWIKANPMLGVTPSLEWMRNYCADAQHTPGAEQEFRVKCCSQWLNAGAAWLSLTDWQACADPTLALDAFEGEAAWIGADLSQRDDIAALCIVFQREGFVYAFWRCYLPDLVVNERARAVPAYRAWVERGDLTLTPGDLIDYAIIESDIRAWCARFAVKDIVFDQFEARHISSNLAAAGWPARTEAKNAKSVTLPARELEARVKRGRFRHSGNACVTWQASNVVVTRKIDDTILPKKEGANSPNKIDAIDALIQALGGMLTTAGTADRDYQLLVM